MKTYLMENEVVIDERQKARLWEYIAKLEQNKGKSVKDNFFDLYFSTTPCEEKGYKGFDYEKLCAMVLFFAQRVLNCSKRN